MHFDKYEDSPAFPLAADLGVNGAALAARDVIELEPALAAAVIVGVKAGESTFRLFFDLCYHQLSVPYRGKLRCVLARNL